VQRNETKNDENVPSALNCSKFLHQIENLNDSQLKLTEQFFTMMSSFYDIPFTFCACDKHSFFLLTTNEF